MAFLSNQSQLWKPQSCPTETVSASSAPWWSAASFSSEDPFAETSIYLSVLPGHSALPWWGGARWQQEGTWDLKCCVLRCCCRWQQVQNCYCCYCCYQQVYFDLLAVLWLLLRVNCLLEKRQRCAGSRSDLKAFPANQADSSRNRFQPMQREKLHCLEDLIHYSFQQLMG